MKTVIFLMSFLWANTFSLATTKGLAKIEELPIELGSFDLSEAYINKDTFTVFAKRIAHIEEKDNKIGKENKERSKSQHSTKNTHKEGCTDSRTLGTDSKETHRENKGSSASIRFSSDVNKDINEQLLSAVSTCEFKGGATVTSGRRNSGYKRSLHRCGRAIDWHYNEDFIDWLLSEAGTNWLDSNELEFFIEDNKRSAKDDLPDRFKKKFRWIPWSTGLHIHMNLKR